MGYYFVIRHFQHEQKEAIKEKLFSQLKDEDLEIICLNDNISWKEDGKEFTYNGGMYDVVKTKTLNGKVLLYCINDKKEKDLIDHYNDITKHNSSNKKGKGTPDNQVNLFINELYLPVINWTGNKNIFFSYDSRLPDNTTGLITPPPRTNSI